MAGEDPVRTGEGDDVGVDRRIDKCGGDVVWRCLQVCHRDVGMTGDSY